MTHFRYIHKNEYKNLKKKFFFLIERYRCINIAFINQETEVFYN